MKSRILTAKLINFPGNNFEYPGCGSKDAKVNESSIKTVNENKK